MMLMFALEQSYLPLERVGSVEKRGIGHQNGHWVFQHPLTALRYPRSMTQSDPTRQEPVVDDEQTVLGPPLCECPVCGAIGLPERIKDHDCQTFRDTEGL